MDEWRWSTGLLGEWEESTVWKRRRERRRESQTARGERETESGRWESVWELGFGRETATGSGGGRDSGFQIQMRDSGLG